MHARTHACSAHGMHGLRIPPQPAALSALAGPQAEPLYIAAAECSTTWQQGEGARAAQAQVVELGMAWPHSPCGMPYPVVPRGCIARVCIHMRTVRARGRVRMRSAAGLSARGLPAEASAALDALRLTKLVLRLVDASFCGVHVCAHGKP